MFLRVERRNIILQICVHISLEVPNGAILSLPLRGAPDNEHILPHEAIPSNVSWELTWTTACTENEEQF